MKFTVLLSVYIKEKGIFLQESLNSILKQTQLPDEIVLVKDGPLTNELDNIINEYILSSVIPFKIVKLPVNQGLGNALNEGLKYCSYDIIARMDTDDIAKSNRFEKQIEILEKNSNIDVVGTWVDEFYNNIEIVLSIRKLPERQTAIYEFAKRRNPINHPTVMFRKEAILAVGGYQHFPLFEDYYLWVRTLAGGGQFYNIQESLLYFRTSSDVYKRRGGWKYALNEYRLRKYMWHVYLISYKEFLLEMPLRFGIRIIPSFIRKYIYMIFLR